MLPDFKYFEPASLREVFAIFNEYGERSRLIAGGTDVLVQMGHGRLNADCLVSLSKIEGLNHIREEADYIAVGALVTHREIEKSALINKHFPVLIDGASKVGSVQIRNVATIGGNACNAAPSADTLPPLLALDAEVRIIGENTNQRIKLNDFFVSPGKTILQPGEVVQEFIIPKGKGCCSGAYIKYARRNAMDLAMLGVAMYLSCSEDRQTCLNGRIALGTAGPVPMRAFQAEKLLVDAPLHEKTFKQAGLAAASESKPRSSFRASESYRREIIPVLVQRAADKAINRMHSSGSGVGH